MKLSDLIMKLMPDNNDQPQVIMANKPFLPIPPKKPLILGGVVLLFIIGLILFQKFYPQPIPTLPSQSPTPAPASATPNPAIPILVFNCPVAKNLCNKGEQINFNDHPALGYSLPTGTKILRIAPVTSSRRINNTLYEAFIFQNKDCYLISYSLLNSGEFSTKLSPPYQRMETIGSASSNLILQLQKISLNQLSDTKNCDITRDEPKDFGSYQPVTPQTFQ